MSDEDDLLPDGTQALWTKVQWAAQGAENDGAISFEDRQLLIELSTLLKAFKIKEVATLRLLLEKHGSPAIDVNAKATICWVCMKEDNRSKGVCPRNHERTQHHEKCCNEPNNWREVPVDQHVNCEADR